MKKVLVISTSLRRTSNSEALADAFAKGAQSAGHEVEMVRLEDKTIAFCKGCFACLKTGSCVIRDDAVEIAEKMHDANVIVFATPVYYYEMSGQMKTLLDRANSLYDTDYAFEDIYLLTVAAEEEESAQDGALHGLQGWISCFGRAHLAGSVFAGGVNEAGDINGHPSLAKAYELGKSV
ncbi:flavodoxin family protein [Enterocloster aldenensis]|uniref:flavodoxin family protein n=1 Tax=Enterocloster aldenensis TaxID=358742 RepID=UPI004029C1B9